MVSFLPPDTSFTFIAGVAAPLILGFLVGIVLKGVMKIGVALILIILVLIAIGIISPNLVIGGLVSLFRTGQGTAVKVHQIAGYLPYSSVTFIIGVVIGFFKG
jgi:uncharacterized membrane protein (Fun14 family)